MEDVAGLVIRRAEVDGRVVDVRIEDGLVAAVTEASTRGLHERGLHERGLDKRGLDKRGLDVLDARGGALLPGLHDHHIHLLALAAAAQSVRVGPGDVGEAEGFARVLAAADAALPPGRWIRAVGYHESVAGPIDRATLDAIVPARPVRVQHRGGAMWLLNTAA